MLMMDALGWTLNKQIQPHVDLYVSLATFKEVQRAFPYLVSKEFASGGGDVRSLTSFTSPFLVSSISGP